MLGVGWGTGRGENLGLRGLGGGGAFRRRNPPAAPLLSSHSSPITHPSFQELTSLLPPPLTCCPPRGGQSLRGAGGGVAHRAGFQVQAWQAAMSGPPLSLPPLPTRATGGTDGEASPQLMPMHLGTPEAHTHMLTPLTSFPRCTLLFHGLGKRGGMGQGQTGRS